MRGAGWKIAGDEDEELGAGRQCPVVETAGRARVNRIGELGPVRRGIRAGGSPQRAQRAQRGWQILSGAVVGVGTGKALEPVLRGFCPFRAGEGGLSLSLFALPLCPPVLGPQPLKPICRRWRDRSFMLAPRWLLRTERDPSDGT